MSYNNWRYTRDFRELFYNYTNVIRIYNMNMSEYNRNINTLLRLMEQQSTQPRSMNAQTNDDFLTNILLQMYAQTNTEDARGISDIEMDQNVRTVQYNSTMDEPRCPISHEDFEIDEEIYQINACGHYFKKESLRRWLRSSRICPVCRNHVVETDNVQQEQRQDAQIGNNASFSHRVLTNMMRNYSTGTSSSSVDNSNNMVYSFEFPLFERRF